jgi:hypothetical protein
VRKRERVEVARKCDLRAQSQRLLLLTIGELP